MLLVLFLPQQRQVHCRRALTSLDESKLTAHGDDMGIEEVIWGPLTSTMRCVLHRNASVCAMMYKAESCSSMPVTCNPST